MMDENLKLKNLQAKAKARIHALVQDMIPDATRIYYRPIFNKLKGNTKIPISKSSVQLMQEYATKNMQGHLLIELRNFREGLDRIEAKLDKQLEKTANYKKRKK